jgi:Plasmid replication region DNA-binding N-term
MQNNEITFDMVVQAGQKLQQESRLVTGYALREMAGGGKPSVLRYMWAEHERALQNANLTFIDLKYEEPIISSLRARELIPEFTRLADQINARASLLAELRIKELQEVHNLRHRQMEKELDEAACVIDELDARYQESVDLNFKLDRKLLSLKAKFNVKDI